MPAGMRSEAHIVITMESLRVGQQGEVSVHDWAPLVEGGEAYLEETKARGLGVKREDTACLIYTSGTGGAPRGVMQHHGAILHNAAGAAEEIGRASGRARVCQ